MDSAEAKRPKQLEDHDRKLKQVVTELTRDNGVERRALKQLADLAGLGEP